MREIDPSPSPFSASYEVLLLSLSADWPGIELTLEEVDQVFSVPTWKHASYQIKNSIWHIRRYVFRQRDLEPLPPLYRGSEKLSSD